MQPLRHTLREEAIALYPIDAEALQLMVIAHEAQAVAVGEAGCTGHRERVAPQLLHRTHKLAHRLRGVEAGNVGLAAIGEIGGVTAIERALEIGCERVGAVSA